MGYTTDFEGAVKVEPPLNAFEISYLRQFNETRRMRRTKGPYFVGGAGFYGQGPDEDIIDQNEPPTGQPGLWCRWRPSDDGTEIAWDLGEKFYYADEWMRYLIDHFLRPGAFAAGSDVDERFAHFTFDHVVNGVIEAQGEHSDDVWRLVVRGNQVAKVLPIVTWPEPF